MFFCSMLHEYEYVWKGMYIFYLHIWLNIYFRINIYSNVMNYT